MLIIATAAAFLFAGYEICRRAWPDTGPFERACYASMTALVLWLATLWITAIFGIMTAPVLLGRSLLVAIIGIALWWRRRSSPPVPRSPLTTSAAVTILLVAVPLMLWSVFIAWRGAILPPVSHDALAHHLPKAVLFARAGGYEHFDFLDARIRKIPANYELLLSEAILVDGTDAWTEWLSLLFYLVFAVAAAALAERWWRLEGWRAAVAGLFAAATPVALLHSGAHKNDLLTAAFLGGALVAAGRWMQQRDLAAAVLAIAAFAAAVGTKPQAAAVAACVAPLMLWRISWRDLLKLAAAATISFLLLGGFVYVSNLVRERAVIGVASDHGRETVIAYGDWSNLWQAPYVLVAAPFTGTRYELPVPWKERPWFWRRYEIYFSHLGIPFALCAVAWPLAMAWFRGHAERVAITAAAVVSFFVILPVDFRPHGMFAISLPRYVLYMVPVVFGWTIAPLLRTRLIVPLAAAGALAFSVHAIDNGANDTFAPIEYVQWASRNRGTRVVAFDPNRAASLVDRRAGPREPVAISAGFGTWIHPAFGADLRRPVHFLPEGTDPFTIPDDVRWVAVDGSYSSIWEHPDFKDLSEARRFLVKGRPRSEETRIVEALRADPRFELVVYNRTTNQAVFRRIH